MAETFVDRTQPETTVLEPQKEMDASYSYHRVVFHGQKDGMAECERIICFDVTRRFSFSYQRM